jgi:acyl dehydratase
MTSETVDQPADMTPEEGEVTAKEDQQSGRFEGRVDEDAVFAYARATNDLNPRYLSGDAVPVAFTATLVRSLLPFSAFAPNPMDLVEGAHGGVHGQHDIHLHGTVNLGQNVQWSGVIAGLKQNRGGVLVTRRIIVSDMRGAPLVEHLWSDFLIGATISRGYVDSALPDHTFPDAARSRPLGSRVVPVDRDQAFRYAGVSSDHAPHAMDDEVARQEGHPGKILQGLCTFGLCCGAVVDAGAGGEPGRLRRIAGRFSAPAFPRRDLDVRLYDAGLTPDGATSLAFEAFQDGVAVITHGRAEVSDPIFPQRRAPGTGSGQ